jgi:hypothetical protein
MRPAALLLFVLAASSEQGAVLFPMVATLEGVLTRADYERVIEREFEVPSGTRRLVIELEYTGADRRTVIDLGLRGPAGLRGWSGGGRRHVVVAALTATPGYLPGNIEPGRWAVLLGVPNTREASTDHYTVVVRAFDSDAPLEAPVVSRSAGWYVGDLHSHSMHSDGRAQSTSGQSTPTPSHRVFEAAARAGLDFVLLSDHNTASHWLDVDRLQPAFDRMLLVHGREVTTYRGHANTVGERRFDDFRLEAPSASPAPMLHRIADAGAFISINHPASPDNELCMGCGWNVADEQVMASVGGVEVVNGDSRSGALYGWPFWAALLNRGFRLTAVGGSDDHTVDDPKDRQIGVPATAVYMRELSEAALVEGLKSGRVYVRTRGPSGPTLEFSAEANGQTHSMGAIVAVTGTTPVILGAQLTGASGQTLEWIQNGRVLASEPVASRKLTRSVSAKPGDWFSLVVKGIDGEPTLLSNAIYVRLVNKGLDCCR